MAKLILGRHFDIGQRAVYEDRAEIRQDVKTNGGQRLTVAMVADGVGGANKGERAAQLAVDTVLEALAASAEPTVPDALLCAVEAANQVVYAEMQKLGGGHIGCTLAIAAVDSGKTLYIANVGDSRIYLSRGAKLTQLTRDHVNRRGELLRVIGILPQMAGDVGFYVNTADEEVATERGYEGLELKKGDSVLVCSDGLVKASPQGQPYTTESEIVDVLRKKEGENAAKTLISYALGRNADDNVTAALIQTFDPARRNRERLVWGSAMAGLGVLAVVALLAVLGMFQKGGELSSVAQAATLDSANQTATQHVIESYTPTPSPSPTPTRIPLPTLTAGQLGFWRAISGGNMAPFTANQSLAASEELYITVPYTTPGGGEAAGGNFYLRPGSNITFTSLFNEQMALLLGANSNVFLQTGSYRNGAAITLKQAPGVQLFVQGSCMAAYYRAPTEVAVSCYEGNCGYTTSLGGQQSSIPAGQQIILNTSNPANVTVFGAGFIPSAEADVYQLQLGRTGEGQADITACNLNRFVSTLTPTPTRIRLTRTPTPFQLMPTPTMMFPASTSTPAPGGPLPGLTSTVPPNPVCGNGVREGGEDCDPPDGKTCSSTCRKIDLPPPPVCGNGKVEAGEQCDPPDGKTCDSNCKAIVRPPDPVCGNGQVETGEECDPPNGSTCDGSCRKIDLPPPPVCGNGQVEAGEQCDPPNGTTCDGGCQTIIIPPTEEPPPPTEEPPPPTEEPPPPPTEEPPPPPTEEPPPPPPPTEEPPPSATEEQVVG